MKKMLISVLSGLLIVFCCNVAFATDPDFKTFYWKLGVCVKAKNATETMSLMKDEFLLPGYEKVDKKRALNRMKELNVFPVLGKALNSKNTKIFPDNKCASNGKSRCIWIHKSEWGIIFELVDGEWLWTEFRAQ